LGEAGAAAEAGATAVTAAGTKGGVMTEKKLVGAIILFGATLLTSG
jgi:hypothetical protein